MRALLNVGFRALSGIAVLAIFGVVAPLAEAGPIGTLVPAYFYPGTGGPGGVGDGWAALAGAAGQIPVTAILNPNSGPLPGPADPNYVNALTNLENAGGVGIAYIPTLFTARPLADAESDATTYITQYGSLIKGFFVDVMTNDNSPADLAYYHSLYAFLKGLSSSYLVVGNPGTSTVPDYLTPATQGADVLVTYENNDQVVPYVSTAPSPWTSGFPAADFANIVYNQPTLAGMIADVDSAPSHHVGSIFVTDQTLPNPYAQLPSYWDQEVAEIRSVSLPEPGTLVLLATGGVIVGIARRRRVR